MDYSWLERETQFTLVEKILVEKILNRRGVMGILQNTWSKKEVKVIKELGVNLFAISFWSKQSKEDALEKGSWSVMGYCLNMKKWEVELAIQDISFSNVLFRIQVHKLPLEMLTKETTVRIRKSIRGT